MKKISLFIAMSLGGYIADHKGGVNWLKFFSKEQNNKRAVQFGTRSLI